MHDSHILYILGAHSDVRLRMEMTFSGRVYVEEGDLYLDGPVVLCVEIKLRCMIYGISSLI